MKFKTLSKLGTEGNLLNLMKGISERPIANITQQWKTRCFPLRSGILPFSITLEVLASAIRQEKK